MQRFSSSKDKERKFYSQNIYQSESEKNEEFIDLLKKINAYSTILIVLLGLVGHFITINVYTRKRNRTNAITVYLLCLAVNDSLFLIVHFFEDTLRTLNNFTLSDASKSPDISSKIISALKIADKFNLTCQIINYLR